ncbi:MAG: phosphoribosylformylglycinamidine synthase subunit PurL [Candidatus Bathyarchaeota archaeon]|nr:phosphoribosylformylglycinamidine synthase subunit PurL [Candidatus Bathyarchaeota archaeon]MDH5494878.1 phosphoribosylformylglycinamidine synthase subunit PurL [Candidatus Bathyarchaeota archaeon]
MTTFTRRKTPFEIYEIKILDANDNQLVEISQELSIGLNLEEMKAVKTYFTKKNRNPTDVELQTIGQTWSEHCFHKTFKGTVVTDKGKIQNLFKTYIAKATTELNPPWCISVFEDNAGIIELNNDFAIAAKVETHNHPSAIEPFGGAATGTGGVIRDILGVWADPIACTDILGFGPLDYDYSKLPQGVKHPKYLFRGVVAGIGCYGNNMGIPTVNGAIFFDESYVGNVVVYCGCIGLLPKDKFVKNAKPSDTILLVGGRTGRDGIHGVTFASAELTKKSEEISRPAVQIANPIEEEKLKRAIIKVRDRKLGSGITDLGGGGLSSAVGEMAHRMGCGARIELKKVPLKYKGLAPWEIYVSESQERMLLLVPKKNLKQVIQIFKKEDVEATPIGKFTDDNTLKIYYEGHEVADLNINFLFAPPKTERVAKWSEVTFKEPIFPEPHDLSPHVLKMLSSSNITSREKVVRTYDHEVKGNTVLKPLHGKLAGPSDAAVIKPIEDSWKGIVISCGMNPRYGKIDPYWMAASAVDEAIRNNTAVGGRRIALLDNFVWGSPEKPDRLGSLVKACEACYKFAKEFKTPFISGKDSLYNESPLGPVTPTLLITAVGITPDIRKTVSLDLKSPGNLVYVVGKTFAELGGSEYYRLKGFVGRSVPKVRVPQAKHVMEAMVEAIDGGCVRACHDISEGGLAVVAAEMAFSGSYGVKLRLKDVPRANDVGRSDFTLFSESNSRFLVEVSKRQASKFESITRDVPRAVIGEVTEERRFCVYGLKGEKVVDADLGEILNVWKRGLEVET